MAVKKTEQYLKQYSYFLEKSIKEESRLQFSSFIEEFDKEESYKSLLKFLESRAKIDEKEISAMFRVLRKAWLRSYPNGKALVFFYITDHERLNFWQFFEYLIISIQNAALEGPQIDALLEDISLTENAVLKLKDTIDAIKRVKDQPRDFHAISIPDVYLEAPKDVILNSDFDEESPSIEIRFPRPIDIVTLLERYKLMLEKKLSSLNARLKRHRLKVKNNTKNRSFKLAVLACDLILQHHLNAHLYATAGRLIGFALDLNPLPDSQQVRECLRKR